MVNLRVVGSTPTSLPMFVCHEHSPVKRAKQTGSRLFPASPTDIEAPAEMAVGAASVEALCASADTALGSTSEGSAPACPIPGSARTQPSAKAWGLGLKRWPVASVRDCSRRPAEHVVTD